MPLAAGWNWPLKDMLDLENVWVEQNAMKRRDVFLEVKGCGNFVGKIGGTLV